MGVLGIPILPGTGTITIGQNAVANALPAGTYEGIPVVAGQAYRVNIGAVNNTGILGPLGLLPISYPVTITGVTPGIVDQDQNLGLTVASGDVTIDKVGTFSQ